MASRNSGMTAQPGVERIVTPDARPLVVGVEPGTSEIVLRTALAWAKSLGVEVYVAYSDPTRVTEVEHADGTVRHTEVDSDVPDDSWQARQQALTDDVARIAADTDVSWHFRYLAGRIDRSLTHLARTVDASAFLIGAKGRGRRRDPLEFLRSSVGTQLAHHQHRPVILVPVSVVDWKEPLL